MLPALTHKGIIAMDIFDGGVGKEQFLVFLQEQVVHMAIFFQNERFIADNSICLGASTESLPACGFASTECSGA
jgi:hypothetical protein